MKTQLKRFAAVWGALTGSERRQVAAIVAAIAFLNAAGWGIFLIAILPRRLHYEGLGIGIGVAFTAWTLGCRHAFDADHIAAIDNSTRKLMAEAKRPLSTGFFFALGHSTVVMLVATAMTFAARQVFHSVVAPGSGFAAVGGVLGTVVSAAFLWLIAALNLVILTRILEVFRALREGSFNERELGALLDSRGLMFRVFGRWMRSITRSRQLFAVGFVFGIGFDTATEVLLLAGTATAASQGLPFYAVLALPLLFAGGLTLFDSFDGLLMNSAYGWAFARPVRRVYYNLTITGLSVAVAFLIGGIEIGGLLSSELGLHGWLGDALAGFDLNTAGYIVVGLFVLVWGAAVLAWRVGRIEQRWEASAAGSDTGRVD